VEAADDPTDWAMLTPEPPLKPQSRFKSRWCILTSRALDAKTSPRPRLTHDRTLVSDGERRGR
jgi:hypothetical protein